MDTTEEKRLEYLLSKLKELNSDMENVVTLGSEVKSFDFHLKKFLYEVLE